MRIRTIVTALAMITVLALASATDALAQGTTISAGFSLMKPEDRSGKGVLGTAVFNVKSSDSVGVGIIGAGAFYSFGDGFTAMLAGGGVRITLMPNAKIRPYVQGVAGILRQQEKFGTLSFSETRFGFTGGGGVIYALTDALGVFGEFDFGSLSTEHETVTALIFSGGVSFRLGGS